jgi:hypothetical protein
VTSSNRNPRRLKNTHERKTVYYIILQIYPDRTRRIHFQNRRHQVISSHSTLLIRVVIKPTTKLKKRMSEEQSVASSSLEVISVGSSQEEESSSPTLSLRVDRLQVLSSPNQAITMSTTQNPQNSIIKEVKLARRDQG